MPPDPSSGATLRLQDLRKAFGDEVAVDDVSLEVAAGEFVTLLGPSGSGKTTTLNMIAGFVWADEGSIDLDGQQIGRLPAHKRGVGMVFQHYALFPHMTTFENIAFPLKRRRRPRAEIKSRVGAALELVRLEEYAGRYPRQLSGGQQQRVALARAIVFEPSLLLMDEPLGALDKHLRERLQVEIKRIHKELGITFVYVTHDQEEAIVLSDRIAVFNEGRIEQIGTPEELYDRPATLFVAQFLGESNVFAGRIGAEDERSFRIDDGPAVRCPPRTGVPKGHAALLVLRPEQLRVRAADASISPNENAIDASLVGIEFLGSSRKIEVRLPGGQTCFARQQSGTQLAGGDGDAVKVCWNHDQGVLLSAEEAGPPVTEAILDAPPEADAEPPTGSLLGFDDGRR